MSVKIWCKNLWVCWKIGKLKEKAIETAWSEGDWDKSFLIWELARSICLAFLNNYEKRNPAVYRFPNKESRERLFNKNKQKYY